MGQSLPVRAPLVAALNPGGTAGASGASGATVLRSLVLYQLGWFACVLLAARAYPWLAALAPLPLLALHLWLSDRPRSEAVLLVQVALVGLAWDSVVAATGAQRYDSGQWTAWLAPAWVVLLWAQFATLLRTSLRWLRGRPWLAAACGAAGGPLAWYAGARLGAVRLDPPLLALGLQAAGWALLTPWLVRLGMRHER